MEQHERIQIMENALDEVTEKISALRQAFADYTGIREKIIQLEQYYTSDLWVKDYEDDEAGKLPKDLKRGVLSQDAIDDMLNEDLELRGMILQELSGRHVPEEAESQE